MMLVIVSILLLWVLGSVGLFASLAYLASLPMPMPDGEMSVIDCW